tara:strand:+ start:312 stop:536 length:225 start_codon:yes stop_codon:yes gene_type:complete
MLAEIHKSKATFCSYVSPEYANYDIILPEIEKINIRTIAEAKRNKAKKQDQTSLYETLDRFFVLIYSLLQIQQV